MFKATLRNVTAVTELIKNSDSSGIIPILSLAQSTVDDFALAPPISSLCILFIYCRLRDRGGDVCASVLGSDKRKFLSLYKKNMTCAVKSMSGVNL